MRFLLLLSVALVLLACTTAVPLGTAPVKLDAKAKKVLPVLAKLQKKYQRLDTKEKEKLLTKADGYRQKFKSVLNQIDDEVAQHYGLEIDVIHEILGMAEPAVVSAPVHDEPIHREPVEHKPDPGHHHEPVYQADPVHHHEPVHQHDSVHSNMVHAHNSVPVHYEEPVPQEEPVHHEEPVRHEETVRHEEPVRYEEIDRHVEPEHQLEPEVQAGILERAAASLGLGGHKGPTPESYEHSLEDLDDSVKVMPQSLDDQQKSVEDEYMRVLDNFVDQQINGDSYQHKSYLEGLNIHKDSDETVWKLEEYEKLPVDYSSYNQDSGDIEVSDHLFRAIRPINKYFNKKVYRHGAPMIVYPSYPPVHRVHVEGPYIANYYDPYDRVHAFESLKPTLKASWKPTETKKPTRTGYSFDEPIRSSHQPRGNQYIRQPIRSQHEQYAYQPTRSQHGQYAYQPIRSQYEQYAYQPTRSQYEQYAYQPTRSRHGQYAYQPIRSHDANQQIRSQEYYSPRPIRVSGYEPRKVVPGYRKRPAY